jgi:hypothetical protein
MSSEFELPEVFDPSLYEGTADLLPIPNGWYSAHIVEASHREALNNSASTYLLAVFEVLTEQYKGRKIFHNITLTNQNQTAVTIGQHLLTDICRALKIEQLQNLEVLLYKPAQVRVGIKRDKDGIYPDKNQITQVRPYDYAPPRRGGAFSSSPQPAGLGSPSASPQPAGSGSATASPSSSASPSPSPSPAPAPAAPGGSAPWRQQ